MRDTAISVSCMRGVFWGIIVSLIANSDRWFCLVRPEALEELYQRVEPRIPENLNRNLPKNEIEAKEEVPILLRPWKVMKDLDEISDDRYSMIFLWKVDVFDAKLRFIARETFGSITRINDKRFAVLFVTGFQNHRSQNLLSQENDKYGDILAFNTPRTGRTADILLTLAAFKWTAETFSDLAEFVVTTHNNELMPFIPALIGFIEQGNVARDVIYCSSIKRPSRRPSDPQSPDYIKEIIYNNWYFPSHCASDVVILNTEMVSKIYEMGRKTMTAEIPPEIYLWGVLREKLRGSGAKNIVGYEKSLKKFSPKPLSYPLQYKRFDAISKAKEMWNVMKTEFTAVHQYGSGRKIEVIFSQTIHNDESDVLIGKESQQFISKWSRL